MANDFKFNAAKNLDFSGFNPTVRTGPISV